MKFACAAILFVVTFNYVTPAVKPLNILAILPHQGKSHFYVFEPYLKELSARGHNVTVISFFPQSKPVKNYNDIQLEDGDITSFARALPFQRSVFLVYYILLILLKSGNRNCKTLLENKQVQDLWQSKTQFDLVVLEQFNSDCPVGLAHVFGAPVIGLTSHGLMPIHFSRFGIQNNPSYVPNMFFEGGSKPTFLQRIHNIVFKVYSETIYKYHQSIDRATLLQYFDDVPDLEELSKDIKALLLYQNFVQSGQKLYPDNVIDVGGYHVAKPKALPSDLKKFIDESEHGVIYISFGSMLTTKIASKETLEIITSIFAELPQRFIWKWESDDLPGNPDKIYVAKWLPQNDILAHPNVVALYSHCGLLGTTEAIHHGVPIVGMPVFGDQPLNAANIEESGFGVQVDINNLSKEKLLAAFKKVLDPEFRSNVSKLSAAWHDRPISAMDSAIFWTEFVAKHRIVRYRVPAADVPWYQFWCLDIYLLFVSIFAVVIIVTKKIVCSSKPNNTSSKSGVGKQTKKSKKEQ